LISYCFDDRGILHTNLDLTQIVKTVNGKLINLLNN